MGKSFRANSDYEHTHRDRRNIEHARDLRNAKKHKREVPTVAPERDEREYEDISDWR